MTPREFRQEQEFKFDHFQELTSTGIKPNYVNIELFAHEYHKRKLKLLGITNVSNCATDLEYSLYKQVVNLKEKVKKLEFMIENGLGEEDMITDITYPSGD